MLILFLPELVHNAVKHWKQRLASDSRPKRRRQGEPRPTLGYPDDHDETCHDSMDPLGCFLDYPMTEELMKQMNEGVVETDPLL